MKKNLKKKLTINKEIITSLSKEETKKVVGGITTSFTYCTGWLCCGPNGTSGSAGPCSYTGCK